MRDPLQNTSLLRQVNERIREVIKAWGDASEPVGFLCECGDPNCVGVVKIMTADYEAIRSAPGRFLLLGGHELEAGEVVARNNGYVIVANPAAA
jgi:hypothetical protein